MGSAHTEAHGAEAAHGHGHDDHAHHEPGFFFKYIWSHDHKMIGKQFLITTLLMLFVGGGLALLVRWQLAYPDKEMPVLGLFLKAIYGSGAATGDAYNMAFTMHASVMIFLVIIPMLIGAFGNYCIPLMIGARDMAFPFLNALSYWFMWPAIAIFFASFAVEGGAAAAGWTSYPPLSYLAGGGQTLWCLGVFLVGASSIMGAVNYITTIVTMRSPGMRFFRMPLTVWAMFITSLLSLMATPVLGSAMLLLTFDREFGSSFFIPGGLSDGLQGASGGKFDYASGGGNPILFQHLFWFYSHPAVYIMILPAMGIVSDVLATFARKPIFGYRPMVYSVAAIAGLGFIVWGHHMFQSGMNPALGMTFMLSTMMIALPSAIKTFNWLATLWRGSIRFSVPMCFALAFVSMFVIGGLSGIYMAATPIDSHIHDTYFIVAHIHYVLFGGSLMGAFAGIYYWFPKMFGRHMNYKIGYVHFWLTLISFNVTFFLMHIVGMGGMPRRVANPYAYYEYIEPMLNANKAMTHGAILLGVTQFLLLGNFFYSMFFGKKAEQNPWEASTLEWTAAPNPPPHGNFGPTLPTVYRGPYEYSSPDHDSDFLPQNLEVVPSAP